MTNFVLKRIQQHTYGYACSRDSQVTSCERERRDVTFCHGISRITVLSGTRHYLVLPARQSPSNLWDLQRSPA
eukprot:588315-Amorphochlora_amoeboformis.AAC.1